MEKNLASSSPSYQNLSKILDLLTGSAIFLSTCSDAKHHTCSISSKCACLWCVLLFCACALWGSWGTERLSHVCEVVWLLGGWAELQIQDWFIAKPSRPSKWSSWTVALASDKGSLLEMQMINPALFWFPLKSELLKGLVLQLCQQAAPVCLNFRKVKEPRGQEYVCVCGSLSWLYSMVAIPAEDVRYAEGKYRIQVKCMGLKGSVRAQHTWFYLPAFLFLLCSMVTTVVIILLRGSQAQMTQVRESTQRRIQFTQTPHRWPSFHGSPGGLVCLCLVGLPDKTQDA